MTAATARRSTGTSVRSTRSTLHRPSLRWEKALLRSGGCRRLAAIDEVGRGALAGPVTVGVVVISEGIGRVPQGLRDSKLLTAAARRALVRPIQRWADESAVGHATAVEIDAIGIMAALRTAARRALAQLSGPVDAILLDGSHNFLAPPPPALFPDDIPSGGPPRADLERDDGLGDLLATADECPPVHLKIKADLTCAAVAGASVLAKTARDALLTRLDGYFPAYGFAVNKGYATPEHRSAILSIGPSAVHRRSWNLAGMPAGVPDDEAVPDDGRQGADGPEQNPLDEEGAPQ